MDGLDIFILFWKTEPSVFDTHGPSLICKTKGKHECIAGNSNFIGIKEKLPELMWELLNTALNLRGFKHLITLWQDKLPLNSAAQQLDIQSLLSKIHLNKCLRL